MKKHIQRIRFIPSEAVCYVTLWSRIEQRDSEYYLYVWIHQSHFKKSGTRGFLGSSLYETEGNAKTFVYGPSENPVWLRMNRARLERDATSQYAFILRTYTGVNTIIHMESM